MATRKPSPAKRRPAAKKRGTTSKSTPRSKKSAATLSADTRRLIILVVVGLFIAGGVIAFFEYRQYKERQRVEQVRLQQQAPTPS